MFYLALLVPVLVPSRSYGYGLARDETCLFQGELRVDQGELRVDVEGGSRQGRGPRHIAPDNKTTRSEEIGYLYNTYAFANAIQERALEKESVRSHARIGPPEHRSKTLIISVIIVFLFILAAHGFFLYRLHPKTPSATSKSPEERLETGPTQSERARDDAARFFNALLKLYPVWIIMLSESISMGMVGPMEQYINLDFFAHPDGPPGVTGVSCSVAPELPWCRDAVHRNLHLTMILAAISPIVHVLLGPLLGAVSDSTGRWPVIAFCSLIMFLPPLFRCLYVFYGLNLNAAFCLTPIADIPLTGVLAAYFADLVDDPKVLAAMFGMMGAVMSFGQLIGMLTGGHIAPKTAYKAYLILKACSVIYTWVGVPESLARTKRAPFQWRNIIPGLNMEILVRTPLRRRLTAIIFFAEFCDAGWLQVAPSFLVQYFDWDKDTNYNWSMITVISQMVWLGMLLPIVVKVFGESGTMACGRWAAECIAIGYLLSTQKWHHYILAGVFFGPVTIAYPVIQALKSRACEPHEQGRAQSSLNSLRAIMQALGPPAFGAIFDASRESAMVQSAWRMGLTATCINVASLSIILLLPGLLFKLQEQERRKSQLARVEGKKQAFKVSG